MNLGRNELLEHVLATDEWDVIVVGGGATGLGTAVDSAHRGYRTLLLEAHDFGKGTSSRSTKLIHGGVRYLRQGNVKMVIKALRERGYLLKNASHLVHPLRFVIPCYRWWHKPWYGIGMKVYDLLARALGIDNSVLLSKEETLAFLPGLSPDGLKGGVAYWDGQFDDTRMLISLARTCIQEGGFPLNYMRVTDLIKEKGRTVGVQVKDLESGQEHRFKSRVVINATGIFTDALRIMDAPRTKPMMHPAQGIHVVLDPSVLSPDTAVMIPKIDDGRVLFGVPWHGHILLGTTDTSLDHIDEEPKPLEEEIDYLLDHFARYTVRPPSRADVLSVFAGLRPLVRSIRSETKSISRDHTLKVSKSGLVTITGGKWTTYRQMAQDTVTRAAKTGTLPAKACTTRSLKLIEAEPIAEQTPLHPDLPYSAADVRRAVQSEMARTLEDVLARRTRALFLNARAATDMHQEVASIMAEELEWTEERVKEECAAFLELAQSYLPPPHPNAS